MIDTYTKIVLTVIALSLTVIVMQQTVPGARAQFGLSLGCDGSFNAPCYIRLVN